jgi:broad specificity phosphatase PhoE
MGILAAVTLVVVSVGSAPLAHATDHHTIILTFVSHALSAANAAEIIDTSMPGPDITALGDGQAVAVATELSTNRYDGIYASTIVRTQQTAAPLSQALGEPVAVLPGLREIEAGQYEGQSEATAGQQYEAAPRAWLHGNRSARIPGSINGTNLSRVSMTRSKPSTQLAVERLEDTGVSSCSLPHGRRGSVGGCHVFVPRYQGALIAAPNHPPGNAAKRRQRAGRRGNFPRSAPKGLWPCHSAKTTQDSK